MEQGSQATQRQAAAGGTPHTARRPRGLPPLFAPLLRERLVSGLLLGFFAAQVLLVRLGLPSWRCPFYMVFHRPCPGCGLSRAMAALLQGDVATAMRLHPFAPLFLAGALLLAFGFALPFSARQRLADAIESVERRTGVAFVPLLGIVVFGVIRVFAV